MEQNPGQSSQNYPVLPLRDIVVFPHMIVPLFVGREKSVKALEDVMKDDKQILLVTQKNAAQDDPSPADIYAVGTVGTGSLPKGTRKRYRMMLNTGTGREYKVGFANVSQANWTVGSGTSISYSRGQNGPPSGTYVWGGRIGERQLFKH